MRKNICTTSGFPFWHQKSINKSCFFEPLHGHHFSHFTLIFSEKCNCWDPFKIQWAPNGVPKSAKRPQNAPKNFFRGTHCFKWFGRNTQGIHFIDVWWKLKLSMPLLNDLLYIWGTHQSPISMRWGTILASCPEPSSTNLNAKYLHRELAKSFPKTAKDKSSPWNLRDILQMPERQQPQQTATNRKLQNRGARCARHMAHRDNGSQSVSTVKPPFRTGTNISTCLSKSPRFFPSTWKTKVWTRSLCDI